MSVSFTINFSLSKHSLHSVYLVPLTNLTCFHNLWWETNKEKRSGRWHLILFIALSKCFPCYHTLQHSFSWPLRTKTSAFSPEFFDLSCGAVAPFWENDLNLVLETASCQEYQYYDLNPGAPIIGLAYLWIHFSVNFYVNSYFCRGNGTFTFPKWNFDHLINVVITYQWLPLDSESGTR